MCSTDNSSEEENIDFVFPSNNAFNCFHCVQTCKNKHCNEPLFEGANYCHLCTSCSEHGRYNCLDCRKLSRGRIALNLFSPKTYKESTKTNKHGIIESLDLAIPIDHIHVGDDNSYCPVCNYEVARQSCKNRNNCYIDCKCSGCQISLEIDFYRLIQDNSD